MDEREDYFPKINIKYPIICNTKWKKFIYIISIINWINPIFWVVVIVRLHFNFPFDKEEAIPIYQKIRYYFGYPILIFVLALTIGILKELLLFIFQAIR